MGHVQWIIAAMEIHLEDFPVKNVIFARVLTVLVLMEVLLLAIQTIHLLLLNVQVRAVVRILWTHTVRVVELQCVVVMDSVNHVLVGAHQEVVVVIMLEVHMLHVLVVCLKYSVLTVVVLGGVM